MDPNLFHLDWERTLEALTGVVVLSFLVERVCALVFESQWWIRRFEDPRVGLPAGTVLPKEVLERIPAAKRAPLKEAIAFFVALGACLYWDFDAVSIIFLTETTRLYGTILTAAVIAGGSKGSVSFFQDVMKVMSSAQRERIELRKGTP